MLDSKHFIQNILGISSFVYALGNFVEVFVLFMFFFPPGEIVVVVA